MVTVLSISCMIAAVFLHQANVGANHFYCLDT